MRNPQVISLAKAPSMRHVAYLTVLPVALLLGVLTAPSSQLAAQREPVGCTAYTVRRVEVSGNEFTRHRDVAKRITFAEGKPFTELDMERTIRKLNKWGHFEKLNRENISATFGSDPETREFRCFVDILINVKEKRKK